MNTQIILLIIFLFIIFLPVLLYFLLLIDFLFGHSLPTSNGVISKIIEIINTEKMDGVNFFDLGCARGKLALQIKKKKPELIVTAVDNSSLRIFFAKLKNLFLRRKINFIKNDIFQIDLSDANIVYAYLWWNVLPPLKEKLFQELKKGSIVITNTSFFPKWEPTKTIITNPDKPDFEKIFIYEIM